MGAVYSPGSRGIRIGWLLNLLLGAYTRPTPEVYLLSCHSG